MEAAIRAWGIKKTPVAACARRPFPGGQSRQLISNITAVPIRTGSAGHDRYRDATRIPFWVTEAGTPPPFVGSSGGELTPTVGGWIVGLQRFKLPSGAQAWPVEALRRR
ncbi:hypothetical protein ACIQUU_13955 [Streptomyces sp. NPDC101116]|uniref:hypothetical protein n=1 Tax=Streptomyces sp. NPDC101116 TaxID=3366107 RepID=UPI0037FC1675